jgi:hypothetical protein
LGLPCWKQSKVLSCHGQLTWSQPRSFKYLTILSCHYLETMST